MVNWCGTYASLSSNVSHVRTWSQIRKAHVAASLANLHKQSANVLRFFSFQGDQHTVDRAAFALGLDLWFLWELLVLLSIAELTPRRIEVCAHFLCGTTTLVPRLTLLY